jgi:hypothetical protein
MIRRTDIVWEGNEVEVHTKIQKAAAQQSISIQDYIKNLLKHLTFLIFFLLTMTSTPFATIFPFA